MSKTKTVIEAEILALEGDLGAMELLARRFFEGRGVKQCYLMSCVWSKIATSRGVKNLDSLGDFAYKKMTSAQVNVMHQKITKTYSLLPPTQVS